MKIEEIRKQLQKVSLARTIIRSGFFDEETVTLICKKLGFDDTSFREKKQKDKLKDYLLSKKYWLNRFEKSVLTGSEE
ncbi:MAG: hypothetical protein PHS93_10115 [Candidatus Omnitrophica bacterium]|nr:hypothetical protein [Candidatus Omnitrophota bacterium]